MGYELGPKISKLDTIVRRFRYATETRVVRRLMHSTDVLNAHLVPEVRIYVIVPLKGLEGVSVRLQYVRTECTTITMHLFPDRNFRSLENNPKSYPAGNFGLYVEKRVNHGFRNVRRSLMESRNDKKLSGFPSKIAFEYRL